MLIFEHSRLSCSSYPLYANIQFTYFCCEQKEFNVQSQFPCIGVLMLLKYFLDIQTLNGLDLDLLNGLDFDLQQDQTSLICESVAFLN